MESVLQGRAGFEHKKHAGGHTNTENKRKKNPVMVKHGRKIRDKLVNSTKQVHRKRQKQSGLKSGHKQTDRDKKKRRRV